MLADADRRFKAYLSDFWPYTCSRTKVKSLIDRRD